VINRAGLVLILLLIIIGCIHQMKKNTAVYPNAALLQDLDSGKHGKTNIGLANFAWNALDCRSGYVYGAVGQSITPAFLRLQANRFFGNSRANLTNSEVNDIYRTYGGHPAFDCIGLIKAYSWIDESTGEISAHNQNAMPDCSANGILAETPAYGAIPFMPDIPGLAVQMSGHIGIYVGNGEVIEAQSNHVGVIKTKLKGRGWKWYVLVPTLTYVDRGTYFIHGQQVTISDRKIVRPNVIPNLFDRENFR